MARDRVLAPLAGEPRTYGWHPARVRGEDAAAGGR